MDSADLVRKFQAGDEAAFAEIFQSHKTQAFRTAFLITGNHCDSENIVQEAFIKCYQNLFKLKQPEMFKSWFYRILTRTAWQYCKKQRQEQPADEILDLYQANARQQASPLDFMAAAEQRSLLLAEIAKLKLKQKTVVVLHYYNGMSIPEIAAITGCTEGTVKSRLFTARRNLKKALQTNATTFDKEGTCHV